MMTDPFSLFYCLQLIRSENVGPITFWQLVRHFGSPRTAIEGITSSHIKKIHLISPSDVQQEIEKHKHHDIHLIHYNNPLFPQPLKNLPDCPPVLSVKGKIEVLNNAATIALVGARNASLSSRYFAKDLAEKLGGQGWVIVSGLARGMDASAHTGALKTGTIAVLAGGVDIIYPSEHAGLYQAIQDTGCIISEMPLGMHPTAQHFPRRNRLISGLSLGVVVVEAALKSGSLITANFALDQGKELFAVPGSPVDPRCRGTNDLLRRGAHVTESVMDILSVLDNRQMSPFSYPAPLEKEMNNTLPLGEEEDLLKENNSKNSLKDKIFSDLSTNPIAIEMLAAQYNSSISELLAIILELELNGGVIRYPNGTIARC